MEGLDTNEYDDPTSENFFNVMINIKKELQ